MLVVSVGLDFVLVLVLSLPMPDHAVLVCLRIIPTGNPLTPLPAQWLNSLVVNALDSRLDGRAGKPPQYFTKPPRPTQPPAFIGTGNEYQPKCGDALRMGTEGGNGSFNLWINV